MQAFDHGVQLVSKGMVEPKDTREMAARSSKMARKSGCVVGLLVPWAKNRASEVEVEQRGDSLVLVMHDSVTKSIFAHLIPAKGVDFPSCEKVVEMIVKDLDTSGYRKLVFRCDNEPAILSLLRAVKLAWSGDVVQRNVC